ncbi:YIP1 family protein [Chitinimonas sp.]|uniref:YIP1 family protein n=1 Tax=Chitinimonas sp. TaxID=1934313 RepID=UPI002F924A25
MQLLTVYTEPNRLFGELKLKSNFILPLVLTIVALMAVWLTYYQRVDASWLIDHFASTAGTPAKQEAIRKSMNVGVLKWGSLIGGPLFLVVIYLISALYYKLAGKICGVEARYGQWLSFTAWAAMPALLSLLVALIQAIIMSPQTAPGDISLTHLDPLLSSLPLDHPWKGWLSSFDLLNLWSIGLAAIGWRNWSGKGWGQAITVAALPSVVIYGIWAAVIAATH